MTTTTAQLASLQHSPAAPVCTATTTLPLAVPAVELSMVGPKGRGWAEAPYAWCDDCRLVFGDEDIAYHHATEAELCPNCMPQPEPVAEPARMVKLPTAHGIQRCDWSGCTDLGKWGVTSRDGKGYCGNHAHRVMHQALAASETVE